jgi:hypothetical protein
VSARWGWHSVDCPGLVKVVWAELVSADGKAIRGYPLSPMQRAAPWPDQWKVTRDRATAAHQEGREPRLRGSAVNHPQPESPEEKEEP